MKGNQYYDLYEQQQKTLGREVVLKGGRLHYLNDSECGLNTAHHKDYAKN